MESNPKFLHFHGIQHSSCKHVLASPATIYRGFNPKSFLFLPCHGFSHSPETMKFGPILFALPRDDEEFSYDNEEEPIIQEHEEHGISISSDNVHEEQLKKVSGGEVKKLEFVVRESSPDEFQASAWLNAYGPYEYPYDDDIYDYRWKHADQELDVILKRYENWDLEPVMCIIAETKEGENVINRMFENVIGILAFHVKYHPKKHGIISDVVVAKIARQQGVGSNMLEFVFEYAKENDIPQIFLQVSRDNKPALALFGKMGFTISSAKATPLREETKMYTCSLDL